LDGKRVKRAAEGAQESIPGQQASDRDWNASESRLSQAIAVVGA